MGWFYGCKWHLMGHDEGERLACRVPTGAVNAQGPGGRMARGLGGQLFGDRGSIARALDQARWAQRLGLITRLRRTMKPRLMRRWERLMLRTRFLIETINDQRKNISQIEHARHRRLTGVMGKLVGGLIAYTVQPKKPSRGLGCGALGLPVVV
jgi:hypothetical protein